MMTPHGTATRLMPLLGVAWALSEAQAASVEIGTGVVAGSEFAATDSSVNARVYYGSFDRPLSVTAGRHRLRIGAEYRYDRFEYANVDSRSRDLHRLELPLTLEPPGGENGFKVAIVPLIATSSNVFKDLASDAGGDDVGLNAEVRWQHGDIWSVGVVRDRRFGSDRVYPSAHRRWSLSRRCDLTLGIPDSETHCRLGKRFALRAATGPDGYRWHVVSDDGERDFDYEVRGWRWALSLETRLGDRAVLATTLGYTIARRHRFVDDAGRQIDANVDDAAFAEFVLRLGLP